MEDWLGEWDFRSFLFSSTQWTFFILLPNRFGDSTSSLRWIAFFSFSSISLQMIGVYLACDFYLFLFFPVSFDMLRYYICSFLERVSAHISCSICHWILFRFICRLCFCQWYHHHSSICCCCCLLYSHTKMKMYILWDYNLFHYCDRIQVSEFDSFIKLSLCY